MSLIPANPSDVSFWDSSGFFGTTAMQLSSHEESHLSTTMKSVRKEKPLFSMGDAKKVAKTARALAKFYAQVTGEKVPKLLATGLKLTKGSKLISLPSKAKRIPKHLSRLLNEDSVQKESLALMQTVRFTRATVAGVVSGSCLLDNLGFQPFLPKGVVKTFKCVNPFLKPTSIGLAVKSMKKTYALRSSLQALVNEMNDSPIAEKREAAALVLTKLLELKPKRMQKKLGLGKASSLKQMIQELQQEDLSDTTKTENLLEDLSSRAGLLLGCKTVRTVTKAGVMTGKFLANTGIAPDAGRLMVYGSVFVGFSNWALQKKYF